MKKEGKVYIEWQHGDADTEVVKRYKVTDIDTFLQFIFEIRGVTGNRFCDDHDSRKREHIQKIESKYPQYEGIVPFDVHFSNYSPKVNRIWLKIKDKTHYIVWKHMLKTITLPSVDDVRKISTLQIIGASPGLEVKNYFDYGKVTKTLLGKVVKIVHVPTNYGKHGITSFEYIVLIEVEEGLVGDRVYGYDIGIPINQSNLYYFDNN